MGVAARPDRTGAGAGLGILLGIHESLVTVRRLVVGEEEAIAKILRLDQIESDLVVLVRQSGQMQVRIARVVTPFSHGRGSRETDLDAPRGASGDLDGDGFRPIFEPLPHFDPHRARRHRHGGLARRVKEPAEVTERRFSGAVALAVRLRKGAGQRVKRQPVFRRLIIITVGADDVHATGRHPAVRRIMHDDLNLPGFRPAHPERFSLLREARRCKKKRLVRARVGADRLAASGDCEQQRNWNYGHCSGEKRRGTHRKFGNKPHCGQSGGPPRFSHV